MKTVVKKLKRSNIVLRIIYYIISVVYIVTLGIFIKNLLDLKGIETALRIVLIIFFILYLLLYLLLNLLGLVQRKYKAVIITSILSILFIAIFIFSSHIIGIVFSNINRITESKELLYTSYLVSMNDTEFNNNSKIGKISEDVNKNDYLLASKLYSDKKLNNSVEEYNDYFSLIGDLYDGVIDAAFLPANYVVMFSGEEAYEQIEEDTKIIYEISEKMINQDSMIVSNKTFNEPLTFLLLGVDSTVDGLNANAAFNGDTLMIVTFNPKTLSSVMFSIPRDTYVPIACRNNQYAKINSAAAYGTSCVVNTVNQFLDINIDYYVKINFNGVVELVEALGGVEVNVEKPDYNSYKKIKANGRMCEQDSKRRFGDHVICVDPGFQTLNGEEALAYARNRHLYAGGDLARIRHQQQVVEAIASKVLKFKSLVEFEKILNAISNNIATNMETDNILTGYQVVKNLVGNIINGEEGISISKAYLEEFGQYVYVPAHKVNTAAQGYYESSLEDIKKALKVSLGLQEEEPEKTFSFSVNEEYVANSPGKGLRKGPSISVLPNFVGKKVNEVEEFAEKNNIALEIKRVDPGDDNYNDNIEVGLVGKQSVHENVLLSTVTDLTIYVVNSAPVIQSDSNDEVVRDDNNEKTTDNEIIENILED